MHTTTSLVSTPPRRAVRAWLVWTVGFLAFPVAGLAGTAAGGRLDRPVAALLGGLATGAVVGLGQALVSSGRLPVLRWTAATAIGMGIGLLLGAQSVAYGTGLVQLAAMGALTGAVLGAAQALALPQRTRRRWTWAVAMPFLWAAGWAVTTGAGIAVENQFTIFGASGAITVTVILGALLHLLVPPATTSQAMPSGTVTTTGALP